MKRKSLLIIACAVFVIIAGGAAYAVMQESGKTTTTTTTETQTQVAETTTTTTTTTTTESTTESTTKKKEYPLLKNNVWYIYDDVKVVAYGFRFEDDENVTVAYFIEDNLNGEDAKYSKDTVPYTVEGDTVIIKGLPESFNTDGFKLKISGKSLIDESGNKLDKQKDLKLEYPFNHYNAG